LWPGKIPIRTSDSKYCSTSAAGAQIGRRPIILPCAPYRKRSPAPAGFFVAGENPDSNLREPTSCSTGWACPVRWSRPNSVREWGSRDSRVPPGAPLPGQRLHDALRGHVVPAVNW
jgi:hypothetical protein